MKRKNGFNHTEPSFAARLFELLLNSDELHVASEQTTKYRNKITYSIPLPTPLSELAQDDVNNVCKVVANYRFAPQLFREVMAKSTRHSQQLMVRITVDTNQSDMVEWKDDFVEYMTTNCPNLSCLCYNETSTKARPTKDHPIHFLYGKPFVLERTPNNLEYQISPDVFCEVNHIVERLQYDQAKEWLLEYCSDGEQQSLLVSGRDVSSFGLCFGSLTNESSGDLLFSKVVAVQHCPLVHGDAVANFERHSDVNDMHVYLKSKQEMVEVVDHHFSSANQQQKVIVGVMTGGRKGLDPSYLNCLVENENLQYIVYNSCSTKSLIRDMEGLMQAFVVVDFRSYNFFPGTSYTASLTLLKRKPPRTLIIPIGPAGVGKSCLAEQLIRGGVLNESDWWQRDEVFANLRKEGYGLNKTKQLVHADLLEFLQTPASNCDLYVDSTNGNDEARQLYATQANADRVLYVVFKPSGTDEEVLQLLMERTRNRLGDNRDGHPSFPDTAVEQRIKHANILQGIAYPAVEALSSNVEILWVDPEESDEMDLLPFTVFLELLTSESIKAVVLGDLTTNEE